jgi:hypothetical protein
MTIGLGHDDWVGPAQRMANERPDWQGPGESGAAVPVLGVAPIDGFGVKSPVRWLPHFATLRSKRPDPLLIQAESPQFWQSPVGPPTEFCADAE